MPSTNRTAYRAVATLSIAAALAGCSAGSSSSVLPLPQSQSPTSATSLGVVSAASTSAAPQPAGTLAPLLRLRSVTAAAVGVGGPVLASTDYSTDTVGAAPQGLTVLAGSAVLVAGTGGAKALRLGAGDGNILVAGDASWTNYHIDASVLSADLSRGGVALLGRVQDAGHYYEYELRPDFNGTGKLFWYIWKFDGNWNLLASGAAESAPTAPFALRLDVRGSTISAYMGATTATLKALGGATDGTFAKGMGGLRNWGQAATFGPLSATGDLASAVPVGGLVGSPAPVATVAPTPAPTPTLPPLPAEAPHSASAFIAGTGVNMHNSYYGTAYTSNTAQAVNLVGNLGVKIVRDGMAPGQYNVCAENQAIAAHGIKFDVETTVTTTAADIAQWTSCMGAGIIASFEGPNEYDISHPGSDANWVGTLQNAQRALYANVKSAGGFPVIGPSVTSGGAASAVGSLSSMDSQAAHIYYGDRNAENGGYGDGGYGSIAYNLNYVAAIAGSKPITVTETGFGTDGGQLSESTQAKYTVRNYLALNNAGAKGIYNYELIDEGGPPFAKMGLVRSDLSPKPSYYALQGLLSTLADSGSGSLAPLGYALTGSTANLQHSLFQKSDGTYVLALWLGGQSADPNSGADQSVAAQNVTLTLRRSIAPTLGTFTSGGRLQQQTLPSSTTTTIAVTDQVQLLSFK